MKLEKGKKLVVYFGYLSEVEEPSAELRERAESKSQTDLFSDRSEEIKAERNKLLEKLNKNREIRDVSDLFVKLSGDMLYNPIFFKIHLPLSLQKSRYISYESDNACTEDFDCVYGGGLLFISAICDLEKEPYGVFDVRDRVIAILETMIKIKVIPPTLYIKPIVFALKTERAQLEQRQPFFEITEEDDSKNILGELFEVVGYYLELFYEICEYSTEINDKVEKIENETAKLLDILGGVSKKNWKNKFGTDTAERRKDIIRILADVAKCQSLDNQRKRAIRDFRMLVPKEPILSILETKDIKFYGEPESKLEKDSVLKSLEYVRSELDSRSRNRYAVLSACTGAIVGSIITLILSRLL